jgi:hypothetical protein
MAPADGKDIGPTGKQSARRLNLIDQFDLCHYAPQNMSLPRHMFDWLGDLTVTDCICP